MTIRKDPTHEERVKHARKQAAITALIIIVYALFTRDAADQARIQAEIPVEKYKKRAETAEQQLATQKIILDKVLKDADEAAGRNEQNH